MSFVLDMHLDFARHNDEVRKVWDAFNRRRPSRPSTGSERHVGAQHAVPLPVEGRVPVLVEGSITNLFLNPELNRAGWTFEDFFTNPQTQIDAHLAFEKYQRYNWYCDREMGPPESWRLAVNFQNSYEAGWFGAPLRYGAEAVPDTVEILKDDKRRLYDLSPPDPLRGNLQGRMVEFFEYMTEKAPTMEFEGRPVLPPVMIPGEGTDGPFTVACKLRGLGELCLDMYEDEKYFHDLMTYVTDNAIRRMKAVREWRWARDPAAPDKGSYRRKDWGFADDCIAMLSVKSYEEFVLPYHKKLADTFSEGPISIHLCGDATHLFRFLRDNLNVWWFDTGFPVDFGKLRGELGPEVAINGGPTVMLLRDGSPEQVRAEVKRICESGIMAGGRFRLREANNLAPCTPVENIVAMYDAAKEFGRYEA